VIGSFPEHHFTLLEYSGSHKAGLGPPERRCTTTFGKRVPVAEQAITDPAAPPGWRTITPRIVARDADSLVAFIRRVFEAEATARPDAPSILTLGDSRLMVSEAGVRKPWPAFLYVYVRDADAIHRRALDCGATSIEPPFDTPYGDRRCMFEDPWGNRWQVAVQANPAPGAA